MKNNTREEMTIEEMFAAIAEVESDPAFIASHAEAVEKAEAEFYAESHDYFEHLATVHALNVAGVI